MLQPNFNAIIYAIPNAGNQKNSNKTVVDIVAFNVIPIFIH